MDKTLAILADYNAAANLRFVAALDALDSVKLEADRGSYYKSLHGLLNHVVGGELFILKFLAAALPGRAELDIPQMRAESGPGIVPFPALADAAAALAAFDAAHHALAASLSDAELELTVDMRGRQRSLRFLLASMALHAAHHRAQASQILDEDGVDNDFYAALKETGAR